MHVRYRQTCRACGSGALSEVIDLGEQYNQGAFVSPEGDVPPLRTVRLALTRCDPTRDERACGLLQTACSIPPAILYARYWYRSGTNRTMREHLAGISEYVTATIAPGPARVLDIGCNDGTLLMGYPDSFERCGVDPSNAIDEIPDEIERIRDVFPTSLVAGRTFTAITSVAMFYDLEDPVGFARAVRELLEPDGIWLFEVSYMPTMLQHNSYDTICHEHLEYYSLAVLERILADAGLSLVDATLNEINGGSIRCIATHAANKRPGTADAVARLAGLRESEFELGLDGDSPYREFMERIHAQRDELCQLASAIKRQGQSIHVYGASTKGNTILQFCGLDHGVIDCAADRNPRKHGARTVGTDIPIVSEEESRAQKPDYYLVLPWSFRSEFLKRERATLESGTSMIFPLPEVEVVGADVASQDPALAD